MAFGGIQAVVASVALFWVVFFLATCHGVPAGKCCNDDLIGRHSTKLSRSGRRQRRIESQPLGGDIYFSYFHSASQPCPGAARLGCTMLADVPTDALHSAPRIRAANSDGEAEAGTTLERWSSFQPERKDQRLPYDPWSCSWSEKGFSCCCWRCCGR